MGYAYTAGIGRGVRALVRRVYGALAGFAFQHPNVWVVVQNQDDYQSVVEKGLAPSHRVTLIPGSGVDLSLFAESSPANKVRMVLLPARMLKDKGVEEFVAAGEADEIKRDEEGLKTSGAFIRRQLKALIANQVWGTSEYYQTINDHNPIVKEALNQMKSDNFKKLKLKF
jgi:hypothetical protein